MPCITAHSHFHSTGPLRHCDGPRASRAHGSQEAPLQLPGSQCRGGAQIIGRAQLTNTVNLYGASSKSKLLRQVYKVVLFLRRFYLLTLAGNGKEKEGEKHQPERETSVGCISRPPNQAPNLKPGPVPFSFVGCPEQ